MTAAVLPACLLLSPSPIPEDEVCLGGDSDDLDVVDVTSLSFSGALDESSETHDCIAATGDTNAEAFVVLRFHPTSSAPYRFTLQPSGAGLNLGPPLETCSPEPAACVAANATYTIDWVGGPTDLLVRGPVSDTAVAFTLVAEAIYEDVCTHTGDGTCDEPEGTGLCAEGTDALDCQPCPYTNDGTCDEPGGTGLCRAGGDPDDCGCPYAGDGYCDEPEGSGLCSEGEDPLDCE